MNVIEQLEAEEVARVTEGKTIPDFSPGDTLTVNVRIKEGERERVQRCLLYTSPSPRDLSTSRMPSSA